VNGVPAIARFDFSVKILLEAISYPHDSAMAETPLAAIAAQFLATYNSSIVKVWRLTAIRVSNE
jgi:hypothetical protein